MRESDAPALVHRALEGVGYSYEEEEQWDEALSTYEELASVEAGLFESQGEYHAARMLLRKGEDDAAKERLQAILTALDASEDADDPYLRAQVEQRLLSIDASLVERSGRPGGAGAGAGMPGMPPIKGLGGPGGTGDLSPEQLQELVRQLQARQEQEGTSE